jgi:methyl-accepting chemotaxis protein
MTSSTKVGSGLSAGASGSKCATDATRIARERLGGQAPSFGFLFASPDLPLDECLRAARAAAGVQLIGCTTAGEFTEEGLIHGGVSVLLVSGPGLQYASAAAPGLRANPRGLARTLAASFTGIDARARAQGFVCTTSVALVDGLSGTGETFVDELVSQTRALHQVVGGASGDEGRFVRTSVGDAELATSDVAAVMHVFSRTPWGVGIGHGLGPTTKNLMVNKAKDNVVYEIDKKPAFEVYREHAKKRGIDLSPKTAGEYLIGNELGIVIGKEVSRARAPLSVGADGSLTCAASVPQGSFVTILDGNPDQMISAARSAATEALSNLQGAKPAGVLLFDCVCRGMILKDRFREEIGAIRDVVGNVPVAGFLTYGEIASYSGRLEQWHNTTAVALVIPA